MAEISIPKIAQQIQTEADAYLYLEGLRWGGTTVCPHCGEAERCYFLNPANGESRKTTRGPMSQRRVWKCGACRKQFSVLTGSIFHGTKISLRTWIFVMFEMCASKNGVSAREIERKYDLTPKSAWFMTQRIREAMKRGPLADMLGGSGNVVVADETFIGGKEGNKHRQGQRRKPSGAGARNSHSAKVAVLSLIDTETGEARSAVVRDVTGPTLRKAMAEQIDMAGSVLHTDAAGSYKRIAHEFAEHHAVDHSAHEYVRYTPQGVITSNQAENFFSQLKRSLDGTHHAVSAQHLPRYLAEFDFRYSTRDLTDSARMMRLMGQTGRRLSYRPLTGR